MDCLVDSHSTLTLTSFQIWNSLILRSTLILHKQVLDWSIPLVLFFRAAMQALSWVDFHPNASWAEENRWILHCHQGIHKWYLRDTYWWQGKSYCQDLKPMSVQAILWLSDVQSKRIQNRPAICKYKESSRRDISLEQQQLREPWLSYDALYWLEFCSLEFL